ncbi:fibronectin type III domain-containing protein, partial [Singulisphaera acidiphila]|uniref:fibronectin type III domain-containing protein n=1 Tax=Singulisphaera acidiphila TaxID=466153 RepID=UPI0018730588
MHRLQFEELERVVLLSTFMVTNTSGSGTGSLAQAIADANNAGGGEIDFNIGSGGFQVIVSPGFEITAPIFINGGSQPNPTSASSPLIKIQGPADGRGTGFRLGAGASGSILAGLFVTDFYTGIEVNSSGNTIGGTSAQDRNVLSGNAFGVRLAGAGASSNVVAGNFIGTDVTGTAALPNLYYGVFIASGASGNTIGGTAAGARNVISGNGNYGVTIRDTGSTGNVVAGNFIGTDATGTVALPNLYYGVVIDTRASGNTIGGTASGARNVISGNREYGIIIRDTGTTRNAVTGNFIGTDVTGSRPLGNPSIGVVISSGASGNTIGGTTAAARNVINGARYGVALLYGVGNDNNVVQGNYIGTDVSGAVALGNSYGVLIGGNSSGNLIGGTTPGSGNVISGNSTNGVMITDAGTTGNVVAGNFIGTDATGTVALPNLYSGVFIGVGASGNVIGGTTTGARNVISGNREHGVFIRDTGTTGNVVAGNFIGTDATGAVALPNFYYGVVIDNKASGNTVGGTASGARNVISGNNNYGVIIRNIGTTGNVVAGNFIGTDVTGSRLLGNSSIGVVISSGASGNTIGGTTAAARNVIDGAQYGIALLYGVGNDNNVVQGNYIGTDVSGTVALGNSYGVLIGGNSSGNLIGGTTPGSGNVISGNSSYGIMISDTGTTGNVIAGNFIGTNNSGLGAVGETPYGVVVSNGASGNTIGGTTAGAGNIIANTKFAAIVIGLGVSDPATGNRILGNSIFGAGGLGIDLANNGVTANTPGGPHSGPNRLQNKPVLTTAGSTSTATVIQGTLNSTPNATFRIEFFANPTADPSGHGPGRTYLGFWNVTTDGSGNAAFTARVPLSSGFLSATATDSDGNTSEFAQNVSVGLLPGQPALTSATAFWNMTVALSWIDVAGATGYRIERSANDNGVWTVAGTVGAGVTTFTDTGLLGAPLHAYRIFATNAVGDSDVSIPWRVVTANPTPLNLTATTASNDRINLAWTDVSTNELGFTIERSTNGIDFTQIGTVSANETTYIASGLTVGTNFQFRVRAYKTGETSAYSNIANASTTATIPNAPVNLVVTTLSSNQLNLSWLDTSDNEQGYKIERSTDGVNFVQVGSASMNATTYADSNLTAGVAYTYRVRGYNAAGDSSFTNTATGTTLLLNHPANLSAAIISSSRIDLSWGDYSNNETGFKVEQSLDGVDFTEIGTAAAGPNSYGATVGYQATGLAAGTVYVFRVRATNAQGDSTYSNVIVARTSTVPAAPTGLKATAGGNARINLAWIDNSTNEQGFKIEQSTDGVNYTQIATVGANQTTYAVTDLTPGTTYSFRVRAYNGDDSPPTSTVSATTTTVVPEAPYGFSSVPVSSTQINLTWVSEANETQGFAVERSTDGVNFTQIATVQFFTRTYQATGLAAETTYTFRIRAYNATGNYSLASETTTATTPATLPAAPTGLTATAISNRQVDLTWTGNAINAQYYAIERSTDGITFSPIDSVGANQTTYRAPNLTPATTYYFRVRATNFAGYSGYTAPATAITLSVSDPTALRLNSTSPTQVTLSWSSNTTGELGTKIERSTDGVNFTLVGTVSSPGATSYSDSTVAAGTTYSYRVWTYTSTISSGYSNTETVITLAVMPPASLSGTVVSSSRIDLAWIDYSTNETGFKVERSTDGVNFTEVGIAPASPGSGYAVSYQATGLAAGTIYFFRVRAYNALGNSTYSNVLTQRAGTPPAAPTNLTATPSSETRINLAWTDLSTNEQGFKIERSTDGVNFTQIATVGANQTAYPVTTGLTPGTTYSFRVRAYNGDDSAYSNTISSTTFATTLPTAPTAPANLTVTANSSSQLALTWLDTSDNEQGFKIERSTDGVNFTQVNTLSANATSYVDSSNLTPGTTYYYRVRAYNAGGDSNYSGTVSRATLLLNAPASLTASVVSSSRIDLAWIDYSTNETGFKVERSTDGVNFTEVGIAPASSGSGYAVGYQATGLAAGTIYFFRVRAYNALGDSAYSNVITARTSTVPTAPTNLTATAGGNDRINLAWTDLSTNEQGFKIERSTDGVNFTQIATVGANQTAYTVVTGLTPGTTYSFRVRAYNGDDSAYSNTATAATATIVPAAPINPTATAVSNIQINLTWIDNSDNKIGYKVERSTDGVNFTEIATVASTWSSPVTYQAIGLVPATNYTFRIRAYNAAGNSAASSTVSATTAGYPVMPTGLTATATLGTTIQVSWQDVGNETGYKLERSPNGSSNWTLIVELGADVTSYTNSGLTEYTTYYYRVLASNAAGNSPYSSFVSATTPLAAPDNVVVTVVSGGQINLTWTDRSSLETNYLIEQSLNGTTGWTQVVSLAANTTSFTATGPFVGSTSYYYRIRAYSYFIGYSAYSEVVSVTTPAFPNAPTGVTATASTLVDGTITLAWTDVANETGYRIERSGDGLTGWTPVGTVPADSTSFPNVGLAEYTRYYYRIVATNSAGDSAPSAPVSSLTPLAMPGSVAAAVVSGERIDLSWTDRSSLETSYLIEQSLNGTTGWSQVGTAAANAVSFAASGPFGGSTTYFFRVRAYSNLLNSYSPYSAVKSATTPAFPTRPNSLTATATAEGTIALAWADATGETGYRIERSLNGTSGWTQVGTAAANATSYTDSGLPENTLYSYRVIATNAAGDSASSASANTVSLLATPGSVTATVISSTRIDLTWTDRSSAESSYQIEQSLDGVTGWSSVGTASANATSFSLTGSFDGSTAYHFRIRASRLGEAPTYLANTSGYSATASGTTPAFPNAPLSVTATATAEGTITLVWGDTTNETGYRIERSVNGSTGWTQVGTAAANATRFNDAGLPENTRYYYRVIAANAAGDSAPSAAANALTLLAAPGSVVATFVSSTRIDLTWIDRSSAESSYQIEQSLDGVTGWSFVDTASANATSFSVPGPFDESTTYYFRVRAYSYSAGYSASPDAASVTTPAFPSQPTNVRATATAEGTITLNWASTPNGNGYRIERSVNGSTGWTPVGTASANATSYVNTGLPENTLYYYRVIATNAAGNSAPSDRVNAMTPLAMPGSVVATVVSGGQINLTWIDRSSAEAGYIIEQSLNETTGWSQVGVLAANATSFSAPGPFDGSTTYYFRIRAYDYWVSYSASPPSVVVTTPAFPSRPASMTATASAEGTITLSWAATLNVTGYRIERSLNGSTGWTQVGTVAANVTSYNDAGLPENTRYYYRVTATNAAGDSAPGTVASAITYLATPGSVVATVVSGGQIDLTWIDRSSAESSYYIEQSLNETTGWLQVGTASANATSFSVPGPFDGSTTYYFRIRAYSNVTGNSASFTAVTVTTPAFPSRPASVTATASAEGTITLGWTATPNVTGYRIERSLNGSTGWTQVGTASASATSYNDAGLPEYTSYSYRVIATNVVGNSAPSATVNATTLLATPDRVTATFVSNTRIDLTWIDRSSAESSYQIEQSLDGVTGWSSVGTASANATSFSVPGPFNGSTTYHFRVRAYSYWAGSSAAPTPATVTTPAFPSRPASVTATASAEGTITLGWTATPNVTGYRIERSVNGSTGWTPVGTASANATSYNDVGLPEYTSYSYRVIATNAAGDSVPSATVNATTLLAAPSSVTATFVSSTRIDLTWIDRSSAESGYQIEQSSDGSTGWTPVGTAAANATNFAVSGAFNGSTTYHFRIRASNGSSFSGYSTSASVVTPAVPSRPLNLTATATAEGAITLVWGDVAGVIAYRIERSTNGSSDWAQAGTAAANATSFTDTGLPEYTRYYYRAIATNAAGDSAPSVVVNLYTRLNTPDGLTATAISRSRIDITWFDRSSAESSYLIEQSLDGVTGWSQVGTASANATSFAAPGPFLGATTYYFRVRASGSLGFSGYSTPISMTTPAFPNTPAGVTATATEGTITLAWTDVANVTGYRIERSATSTGGWAPLGTTVAGVTSYTDTERSENLRFYYRVVAINAAGISFPSTTVNAMVPL